jgi:hypothetical protein
MSTEETTSYEEFESDLGLDEEDRKNAKSGDDIEWYKGSKGKVDRASIIYFHPVNVSAVISARKKNPAISPDERNKVGSAALAARAQALGKPLDALTMVEKLDLSQVQFKKFTSNFGGEGIGFVLNRLGKDGAESDLVWKKLGAHLPEGKSEAKTHFSTLLVLYPTNKKGEIDKSQFAEWAKDPVVKPWKFSQKRYDLIWKVNMGLVKNGASIADQDLLLECKDDKFQQIEPQGDGKATWLKVEKLKQIVLNKALAYYDKLVPAREMTTAQLRDKLGLNPVGGSAVQEVSSGEFQEMLDNV